MFEGKIAVVTGGAQGIGRTIAGEFEKNGAKVCVIDKQPASIIPVTWLTRKHWSALRRR